MGNKGSITNTTPYNWILDRGKEISEDVCTLYRNSTREYSGGIYKYKMLLRYENNSSWDLSSWGDGDSFTLRESSDRRYFELVNNSSRQVVDQCPHFGRIEEEKQERERRERERRQQEEQRQREEEEKRRQAELERKKRIQQQIEKEKEEERRRQAELERKKRIQQQIEKEKEEERRRQAELERMKKIQQQIEKEKEEERRRQAELERKKKIQQQIEKENKASRKKLSEAYKKFQETQSLEEQVHHQQQTQVLHQMVGDEAAHFKRDELCDVIGKFDELLSKYQITENGLVKRSVEDRMKILQDELTLNYFREHKIPVWSQWALDQATGYVDLSLTERFCVLEAVVKVTMETDPDFEDFPTTGQDKKIEFLLSLQEQLHVANPTLARKVLVNVLDMTSQLPQASKEILSQILFNNIWTPKEIKLFIGWTLGMDQEKVILILHKVFSYRLSCLLALSALNDKDPIKFIQGCISDEMDKDADTILSEMEDKNYPEHILSQLEDILQYVEKELPKYRKEDMNPKMIEEWKRKIVSLDFVNPNSDTLKNALIVLAIAVKKCTTFRTSSGENVQGYFPRLTQLASLLLLLLLPQLQDKRGCLLEIGTGEGKTCILAMFATIQAVRGTAVDIVTSSPVLAIRDQEEWRKLYDVFGLSSSTVPPQHQDKSCFENQDKLLEDAYRQQIVYGTVSTFAADILRQEFEKKTTRGQRTFECVIVDEVDYMTLDSGVQVTFLSHQANSLRHVEQVLAGIWTMVSACRPIEMLETGEIKWINRIQHFHKAVKQAVIGSDSEDFSENDILLLGAELGFYSQEDLNDEAASQTHPESSNYEGKAIENIVAEVGPEEQYKLLTELKTRLDLAIDCYSVVNNKAKLYRKENSSTDPDISMLLLQNGRACEILSMKSLVEETIEKLRSKIKYSDECSLKSFKESERFIVIPFFLKDYIEDQLAVFAENALKAITMTPGREYMIDKASEANTPGFSGAESHHYDAIIPVDFQASGVLEKNKRWGDGLQQFLEMKHQLAISQLTNVTNYMSNVHFFKRYLRGNGIFGVSGTLGGEAEKAFLERQYKTASFVVPAHRHNKLVELPAVQLSGNPEWIKLICETAWKAADRGQVVLIICEDVKTADEMMMKMDSQQRRPEQITMYTISAKHNIEKQMFNQGNIIIATNLGGRGTDVHVQQEVNKCGGLFVLLTYFPGSHRVERQIFGRTARKGNPGVVQMILNRDHLAPAYQGHSLETMRQLREEHEFSCLDGMEKNELLEIERKESLFSHFCEFLCDFDNNYSQDERSDLTPLWHKRFDYQPALNALKESWALWLILHEEHISKHDITLLREDLIKDLKKTAEDLLRGKSNNFNDYIEMAKSRTDMHRTNKDGGDYGALSCWKSAAECDPFYSAVALYNQAYIIINLQKRHYITEAKRLLMEAQTAVDVYLSESANTMAFCNLSVTKDFTPHHQDSNLQAQMGARMAVFKSWKGYIENALKSLEQIEKDKNEAITEESSVYSLSKDEDPITTKEIMGLSEFGLCTVFDVKKKPTFSLSAFLCFCLGVVQVVAGILVCVLSSGTATHVGLELIGEGISDMIHGIEGMKRGSFDWAKWAVSKAISIGASLAFGGFNKVKKAFSGTKGLITVTKSCSFIVTKHVMMHAVLKLNSQGCNSAQHYAVTERLTILILEILKTAFEDKVLLLIRASINLEMFLIDLICSGTPKAATEQGLGDFKIDKECKNKISQSVDEITKKIVPSLMDDCTKDSKVLGRLSEVCDTVTQHQKSGMMKSARSIKRCAQILDSVPTNDVINKTFVPQLLQTISKNLPLEKYDQDGRHQLSDVQHLKDELFEKIARSASDSFVEACSKQMTNIMNKASMSKINIAASSAVSDILDKSDNQSFLNNQLYKQHMKEMIQDPCVSLSEADRNDLTRYIRKICDVNHPATALDIYVLTQSDFLQGKGIKLIVVDKEGNKLSEDYYPGKDISADDIMLRLTKYRKTRASSAETKWVGDDQTPYRGHFEVLRPDGSVVPVYSKGQNCLYHAVAQAISKSTNNLEQAVILRKKVKDFLLQNLPRYAEVLKLQRGYEEIFTSADKYYIIGGRRRGRDEIKKWKQKLNCVRITCQKLDKLIKTYKLGLVGTHAGVIAIRKENKSINNNNRNNNSSPVNADHCPPLHTYKMAQKMLKENGQEDVFKKDHPELYQMITDPKKQLTIEVLTHHHQMVLTSGRSQVADKIRKKLAQVLVSGDKVKLIKMSLIAANPEMSECLRRDAGIHKYNNILDFMSGQDVRLYHSIGDQLLVEGYVASGLLNNNEGENLLQWLREDQLYSFGEEYNELLKVIRVSEEKSSPDVKKTKNR